MELNEKKLDLIGAYLQGRLEGDALSQFLQDLESNPELKKEAQIQKAIQEGIEHRQNLQLRQRFEKIAQEEKQSSSGAKVFSLKFYRIAASVAAVLVICFGAYFLMNPAQDNASIYASYFEPSELSITRSTDIDAKLAELKELYNTNKYKQALPLFESVIAEESTSNLRLAYGSTLLKCNKLDEAEIQFNAILESNDPLYSDQSKWYLALLEVKRKNLIKAQEYLVPLAQDSNADNHEKAKLMLEEIKELQE